MFLCTRTHDVHLSCIFLFVLHVQLWQRVPLEGAELRVWEEDWERQRREKIRKLEEKMMDIKVCVGSFGKEFPWLGHQCLFEIAHCFLSVYCRPSMMKETDKAEVAENLVRIFGLSFSMYVRACELVCVRVRVRVRVRVCMCMCVCVFRCVLRAP